MTYYFRADLSRYVDNEYPSIIKINTTGELRDYYASNKETYQFGHGYYCETSMADGVFSDMSGFDDDFFKANFLLFIILQEGSGSVRHRVESVSQDNNSLLVKITRIMPEIGTCDMAQWHIVLVLDKSLFDKNVELAIEVERPDLL